MTTLENSYCVPKTEEEWDMLYPNVNWLGQYPSKHSHVRWLEDGKYLASWPNEDLNRNEIPVQHFIDLAEDRISGWQLLEFGFSFIDGKYPYYEIKVGKKVTLSWSELTAKNGIGLQLPDDDMWVNITTFTDLLTQIKFLTPPTK